MHAEQITAALCEHAEGPVWSPVWGALRWVDMYAGDVLQWHPATGAVDRWHVGSMACALRPCHADGEMIIARERDFVITADGELTVVAEPSIGKGLRFNDGACDPQGRFLCGTFETGPRRNGAKLYELSSDYSLRVVLENVSASNGLCWTGDGSTAYYVDSGVSEISVLDHHPVAGLQNRRSFVAVDSTIGGPDGITVDAEGGVWAAIWGGGVVHRYSPEGVLDFVIEVPTRYVTACTFGDRDLDVLYITTSRYGEASPSHSAGAIFASTPGVRGLRVLDFGG